MKPEQQFVKEVTKLLVIHSDDILDLKFEINEIQLSLESLEERLKELISQRGDSHKD